jgi:hypothetical protein
MRTLFWNRRSQSNIPGNAERTLWCAVAHQQNTSSMNGWCLPGTTRLRRSITASVMARSKQTEALQADLDWQRGKKAPMRKRLTNYTSNVC